MMIRRWFPVVTAAVLVSLSAGRSHAGSFFGPCCYGAGYAYQYPNRSHNVFGCGWPCHCVARHPLFEHFRKHKCPANCPAPVCPEPALAANGEPPIAIPAPAPPH